MMLSDVCLSRASVLSREQRPRKTKISTEVAHVTCDSDTTFKVKWSKVKVTRPLCSAPCWRVRRLQRWARERVGRGKLLLRCCLLGGGRRFGDHGGRRGVGAYRGGRPPTACFACDRYDIMNYQKYRVPGEANYAYKYTRVGGWIEGNLTINERMIFWPNPTSRFNASPVQSFCSEPCPRGHVKV